MAAPFDDQWLIDGKPVGEMRFTVATGAHVLAFAKELDADAGFVFAQLRLEPAIQTALLPTLSSAADGRWRFSTQQPPPGWELPGYDDSAWPALVAADVPDPLGPARWSWESLSERTTGLGLPTGKRAPRVWVRWSFHVDGGGFS